MCRGARAVRFIGDTGCDTASFAGQPMGSFRRFGFAESVSGPFLGERSWEIQRSTTHTHASIGSGPFLKSVSTQ